MFVNLMLMEHVMNDNEMLHAGIHNCTGEDCPYRDMGVTADTCIKICAKYGKHVFSFALALYDNKYHSGAILQYFDNNIVKQMKFKATL